MIPTFKAPSSVVDERVMGLGDIYRSARQEELAEFLSAVQSSLEEQLRLNNTPERDTRASVLVVNDVGYEREFWRIYLPCMVEMAGVVPFDYRIDRMVTLLVPESCSLILMVQRLADIAREGALHKWISPFGERRSARPGA